VAAVTIDRVAGVRADIAAVVNQTLPGSTLPAAEQDRMLEQACGEACGLLTDCLARPARAAGPADDAPFGALLRDREFTGQLSEFLGPLFADALDRSAAALAARGHGPAPGAAADPAAGLTAARAEAAELLKRAAATGRRLPRLRRGQVIEVAAQRIGMLRDEACQLTAQLRAARQQDTREQDARPQDATPAGAGGSGDAAAQARRARLRRGAVATLRRAGVFFLGLMVSLSVSVAGPQQAGADLSAWTHGVEVVVAHDLAALAQPGLAVSPPSAGPHLS
jgi:hypothetical protein